MSRRRYISTSISTDKRVNQLAREAGDFAALLYTWMIPHAEDSARMTGDVDELLLTVVPGLRHHSEEDVAAALEAMDRIGLIVWDRDSALVLFDPDSFYRHQSYIPEAKRADSGEYRRESPQNAAERRESPQNAASPSPSPTPSPTPSRDTYAADDPVDNSADDLFLTQFWPLWPHHKGSKQLAGKRFAALTGPQRRRCLAAEGHVVEALDAGLLDPQYLPRAENFVGGTKCYYREWADGIPEHLTACGNGKRSGRAVDSAMGALREVARQYESEVTT